MTEPRTAETGRRDGLIVRIRRRRMLAAVVFASVMAVAIGALLVLPVRYMATGSVIVAEPEPGLANASPAWAQKVGDPADLESQLLVIRSPRVIRLAMQDPKTLAAVQDECRHVAGAGLLGHLTAKSTTCDQLQPDSEALIQYVASRYSVGTVGRSRVINISYSSPLPEVAQTLANALVNAFLDDQRASMSKSRGQAAAWLWQEIDQLDQQLRDEDAKIQAFRRNKGLMRGATAPISSEQLTAISNQLTTAIAARADAAGRLQEIKADGGSADAPAVLESRTVSDLKQQLTTVSALLASTARVLGPNHPKMQALVQQRDDIQARLKREVASLAVSAQKTYDAADALVKSLTEQQKTVKAEVSAAMADEASIDSMVRSADIKRQQYAEIYKRASELETERRVLIGSTQLVNLAEMPDKPFFPRRTPFFAAGFTFALLLAAAAALLRDRFDHSVRGSSELSVMTGAPILAQLPRLRHGNAIARLGVFGEREDTPLRVALQEAQGDRVLQDSLRKLYANLILTGGTRVRTLQMTSSGPREGKTFTTLALAQLVARTGRRVLVVECDMRRPNFAEALGIDAGPGLESVLRGETLPSGAVVRSPIANLDVMPAAKPTADSTELLMSEYMSAVAHYARAYDIALFDSPPAGFLMDAHIVAKHVDSVLCCTRWGYSSITEAVTTVNSIRSAGGNVLGMAITMVKPDDNSLYERVPVPSTVYIGATG